MNGMASIFWQFFIARNGSKVYDIVDKTSINSKESIVFIYSDKKHITKGDFNMKT